MDVFEDEKTDSVELLGFLYKKWKIILGFVLLSLVVTTIITFFIPKRYGSYAIVFPVSNNNLESVIESPLFGYDIEADRMIQLLESDEVRDSVTQKFNLLSYYGIDKSDPGWRDELVDRFVDDITFVRTPYMSIIISAETEKPELSAEIANYIMDYSDGIRTRIFKSNQLLAFRSIEKEYNEKKMVIDSLKNKMEKLRESSQSDLIAILNPQGMVQASGSAGKSGGNSEFERTLNQYLFEQSQFNELGSRYAKAKSSNDRPITKSYVVNRAKPSYKKISPSYKVNLAISGVTTLVLTIIVLLIIDKLEKLRPQLNKS